MRGSYFCIKCLKDVPILSLTQGLVFCRYIGLILIVIVVVIVMELFM